MLSKSKSKLQRRSDPAALTVHTRENLYTPKDLECAAKDWPRSEVEKAFAALKYLTDCWLEVIPNRSVWQMIEGGRVVNKWCESLPGSPPGGGGYDYFGINEVIYGGGGQFRFMYSLPDLFGLTVLYSRWKTDGQHETHGDICPGLSK